MSEAKKKKEKPEDHSKNYWYQRCMTLDRRIRQLEWEIHRLRGRNPLTKVEIQIHNKGIKEKALKLKNY